MEAILPGQFLKEVFSWSIQEKSSLGSVVRSPGRIKGMSWSVVGLLGTWHSALGTLNLELVAFPAQSAR